MKKVYTIISGIFKKEVVGVFDDINILKKFMLDNDYILSNDYYVNDKTGLGYDIEKFFGSNWKNIFLTNKFNIKNYVGKYTNIKVFELNGNEIKNTWQIKFYMV